MKASWWFAAVAAAAFGAARADTESERLALYRDTVSSAVDSALAFLARTQQSHGAFPGWKGDEDAIVGLAGMAFLSTGATPGRGPYGETINSCVDYILDNPSTNGYLGARGGRMYGHGIATLFLSEVDGMVDRERQKRIDAMLPKALQVILDAQQVPKEALDRGGWRYEPTSNDSDISVTGWQLMALRSARLNGAPVPASAIEEAIGFIDRCRSREDDGGFGYTPPQLVPGSGQHPFRNPWWTGGGSDPARTGVALLCRELAGRHGDEANRRAAAFVLKDLQARGFAVWGNPEYAMYYCAQGMFQLGGASWEEFAAAMYKHLLATQQADGAWRAQEQGDVYPTAMYVLALTVSYRQLPIYQR